MYLLLTSFFGLATLLILARKTLRDPRLVVGFGFLLMGSAWQLFSCLVVESGIYVIEQGRFGAINGASLLFILFVTPILVRRSRLIIKPSYVAGVLILVAALFGSVYYSYSKLNPLEKSMGLTVGVIFKR